MASTTKDEKDVTRAADHQEVVDEAAHTPKDIVTEATAKGQGVTGYETLSPWKTILQFKTNSLICFLVTLSAATDGYQIGCVVQTLSPGCCPD